MANKEHLEILTQGVNAWNKWRKDNPKVVPQLDGLDLSAASLVAADLRSANLVSTTFRGATLRQANLQNASLIGTILVNTQLQKTNFSNTHFGNTVIVASDLSQTVGLKDCYHFKPSYFDPRTVQNVYLLPVEFLRGVGLSDWEIEQVKLYNPNVTTSEIVDISQKIFDLRTENPIQFFSCFISYSHSEKAFARKLHDTLQEHGIRVWLDEHQMLPGDDIYEGIDHGIRHWDKVLLCASKDSLTSWWVDNEIDTAFEKERQIFKERAGNQVKALIPLDLDGFMFSDKWKNAKKKKVLSRVAANFKGWEKDDAKFNAEIQKVIKALRADDMGRENPPKPLL